MEDGAPVSGPARHITGGRRRPVGDGPIGIARLAEAFSSVRFRDSEIQGLWTRGEVRISAARSETGGAAGFGNGSGGSGLGSFGFQICEKAEKPG